MQRQAFFSPYANFDKIPEIKAFPTQYYSDISKFQKQTGMFYPCGANTGNCQNIQSEAWNINIY